MEGLNRKNKIIKLNSRKICALSLLFVVVIANLQQSLALGFFKPRINNFRGSPSIVDVNEPVQFTWNVIGSFDIAIMSYGDGNQTEMTMTQEDDTYLVLHTYAVEGKYNASLYVANSLTGEEDWDASFITVQNNPPKFDLSTPFEAEEDELVNISIINLQESDHDKKMGVISYLYDFADNNQTTTNSTSILHKWSNVGIYPMTVTARDDQNALFQRVQKIEITNRVPEPDFSLGSEIPATYGFYSDLIGAFPFGWVPLNNESFEAFIVQEGVDNHQKILEISSQPYNDVEIYNVFDPQSFGTVEFWFMSRSITTSVGIFSFKDGTQIEQFSVFIKNGRWYYRNGDRDKLLPRVPEPINGVWQHIRIDFLNIGNYLDLSSNTFQIIINNVKSGIKSFSGCEIERIHISSDSGLAGETAYVDAIGYSWSPDYKVGYNYHIFGREYYATYDFREESMGGMPNEDNWNLLIPGSNEKGSFSITDAGYNGLGGYEPKYNPFGKVVEIKDTSEVASLVMEHNYTNQPYGTIEFWVMTNNPGAKTWAFCLMQNDILALAILMDDNKWKYTLNDIDYYTIQNVGIPKSDRFYHVRIDFRGSGADDYFSLQENRFKVFIDNVSSPQYPFATINSISKTRIVTGRVDTGIAYMDSIGYSWDRYYDIGDNRIPAIHFPEKTLIWLSASLTTDTHNDVDSLSYFWDFGENSDFGKYVSYEFVTSGKYYIKLTVMDDNGEKASKTRIVLIGNKYPDIEFTAFQGELSTYEGTTVIFNTVTDDENADIAQMDYYWHLNDPNFDPYNVSHYQQGGWVNSYTFTDDHNGQLYAMATDPEGAFDFDFLNITILNVNPSVSIHSLDVIANITFEVERSGPPFYDNNFTFLIQDTDKFGVISPFLFKTLNFVDSEETTVNYKEDNILLNLLKDWKILVNTSSEIYGKIQYTITLDFQDGQQEVIQSSQLSSGNAFWELQLNPVLYDDTNYTIKHPIQAGVSIWDPSVDDINLDLNYSVEMVVEIQCLNSLPIEKSFSIDNTFFYNINVYESDGKAYVNISAYTHIAISDGFKDYEFPVNIDSIYTVEPIIDLTKLLINHPDGPQLSDFSVVESVSAVNFLNVLVRDDDGGSSSVVIDFNTQDGVDVYNLCPDITLIQNNGGLMGQNLTFYLDYYYRSYYRDDKNMVFESISTYNPYQEQSQSSTYGSQVADSGSGGDSGKKSIHQSTDADDNFGSVLSTYGSQVNSDDSDSGTSFPVYGTQDINDYGVDSMSYSAGTYDIYTTHTGGDTTDYSRTSWAEGAPYHYPGSPGNSWETQADFDDGSWTVVEQNGYANWDYSEYGHYGLAKMYYDGSGASSYIRRVVGEQSTGTVEFWARSYLSDLLVGLDNGGSYDILLQFNENGIYFYDLVVPPWPFVPYWAWQLITGTYKVEETWRRIKITLQADNWYNFAIYDENYNRIFATTLPSQSGGTIDSVKFCVESNSPLGYVYIDAAGLSWDSGYEEDGNRFQHQHLSHSILNVPMEGMNKDNYNRATNLQTTIMWKINYWGDAVPPTFYVTLGGGDTIYTNTNPTNNYWYYTTINIDKSKVAGDYDLDFWLSAYTDTNDKTGTYYLYVYDIATSWKESRNLGGNKFYYCDSGGSIDTGAHEINTTINNNFKRDHVNSFDFDLSWTSSYSKTFYVQLWDYDANAWDSAWGDGGPHTGSGSLSASATVTSNPYKFFEDNDNPKFNYRLYSSASSEPTTVELISCDVDWSSEYTYNDEHEITLSGMNQFRYISFDTTVNKGIELIFTYTSDVTTGQNIKYEIYDWATGYVTETTLPIPANRTQSLRIYDKDFIHNTTYKVRIKQTIIGNTECELAGLSHEYFWDYSYYDTYRLKLDGMKAFRVDHITQCIVSYSIGTHDPRTINVQAYKHWEYINSGTGWNTKDTASTPDNTGDSITEFDSDSFSIDKDYIYEESGDYYIDIHFDITTSPLETIFQLENNNSLTAEWEYSYSWNDEFEVSLAPDMNDFRYDYFDDCTLSYTITTRSGTQLDVSLWDYTLNGGGGDWVFQETVTAGSSYQDSVYFTSTDYIHSSTYEAKIKFDGFSNSEFELNATSASWDYSYSYYNTYELDLSAMTQFRYTYFDECKLDYQIDLPRAGKSTTVYLYNFTKSDWDYFKTTVGGANDIQDSITFTSLDYIDSNSNKTRIQFTGFSDTEFNRDSIVANYSWEYNVQDKYSTVLRDMTALRYNSFEKCNISFSIQTTEDQTLQVKLFNLTSSEWIAVGSPFNTIKDTVYNGFIMFTSDEFVHPSEFSTKIFFSGIQDSFLTLNILRNNYTWSHFYTYTDFGYDIQGMEGIPYTSMEASYRNVYEAHNVFDYAGDYVVTWTVSDGMYQTLEGQLIEIIYPIPSITIGDIPYYIEEDEQVYLESNIDFVEEFAQEAEYQFFWDFGDGTHNVDRNPTHAWSDSGNYTVILHVCDLYGNYYNDTITAEVNEKLPEIVGPYGFQGIEGQAIILDVAVSDSILDRRDLSFTWYDENEQEITLFTNNPKPTVILNDGIYEYGLEVEDSNGNKVSTNISITVIDIPPSVFISSQIYHGDQNSGSLTLTAYAFDYCEDMNTLEFTWKIAHNGTIDTRGPYPNINRSSIQFDATKTAIYQGEVSVYDSSTNTANVAVFSIVSVIDSNGNGFSDEFESNLAENGENIYDYYDSDNDGLSDTYELSNNETWYLDPDTDGDGLYDGVYRLTGIGESTAGTDPGNFDSDSDELSDGDEVYGWTISTELEGEIFVSSDPWVGDTDGDGWNDFEEFGRGTHPRRNDTDLDGVPDPLDPFPLKADTDEDGFSDSEEIAAGTACDNSDTDSDSINDGAEVRGLWGYKTDPLSKDSDHDFIADNAEVIEKSVSIRDRMNLDQPVILNFANYFTHATYARISFLIAFGEADGTVNYGVQDVPDLNIKISKTDNNLILYEGNTGGNRYFSQIVDFKEEIEDNSFNYYGQYAIQIDEVASGCLLEQFDINVGGYLDPNDDDSDNDGIMDGIEMDTLVQGTNIIDVDDLYELNNISVNTFPPPTPYGFSMETGSVDISNTIDQSVVASIIFENIYRYPVVVAYINSRNDARSVDVRVDNVTSVGCDIFMEEPDDGSHGSETISYIVMEGGEYTLPNGLEVKAGRIITANSHEGSSSYDNWENASFKIPFSTPPVVLHSLNTYNNQAFKTSIVSDIAESSFRCQQETAESGTATSEETIGWIAFESGKEGTINNVKYETLIENDGSTDGVDDNGHMFFFQSFLTIPDVVVVKQITTNNGDGSWARSQGTLSGSTHVTYAEEDQVGDSERSHPDEYFGLVAFESAVSFVGEYTPTPSNDFYVIRGTTIISDTSTSATIYEGLDYNLGLRVGASNSFIQITDTMHTGMGRTSSGGNQNHEVWGVRIQDPDNIENSITFERDASGTNCRVSWEIVQYTGLPGGANEFIVRDVNTATASGATATFDGIEISTISNINKVIEEEEVVPEIEVESYYLTIQDLGRVYNANITIEVASENTPSGYGIINVTLVKEDISNLIDDVILIDYYNTFDQTDIYLSQFLDLTAYVNDDTINQFYGDYRIDIVIFNNNTADIFNITEYYIETDTYIKASEGDTNAWITDPSTPDSDGDTITDYAEIYGWTRGSDTFYTNPLSLDSDGDGADDYIDRRPTENVMIKISPLSATHRSQAYWEASPELEIAISYELNGDDSDRHKIFTPAIRATEDLITQWILWFKFSHYRETDFAANDINYYVDIDDNPNIQPDEMDFSFTLWQMDVVDFFGIPLWDTWLAGESFVYSIGDVGQSTTFDSYYTGIWGEPNELHVKVETISVDKSNTIAIYKNDTLFNGHYEDKEKMNIFILNITDSEQNLAGTPFVNGPNAIIIPTRLFTQTKLNGYIEREELDQTPLYSSVEGEYEFISVGRNGTTEKGCDEVDFIVIRYNIDVADAMNILSLLITVIANSTTEEELEMYKYQSTKENGTSPVLMNLYKEVLGYIPWFCDFKNSDQGPEPADFGEFWAEVFIGAIMSLVYLVIMIGMAIAQFFMVIVGFVVAVFMEVLSFLGPLLWLIIRAILLIFVYILLAIELIFISIQVLIIGTPMLFISELNAKMGLNWIVPYSVNTCAGFYEITTSGRKIRYESWIEWGYWPFFDLYFPLVNNKIIYGDDVIQEDKEGIIHEESSEEYAEMKPTASLVEVDPVLSTPTFYNITSSNAFYSFNVMYNDDNLIGPDSQYGVRLHLIEPDGDSLGYYEMDTIDETPDYSYGVMYNYTIDVSSYTDGLWHYYFTTKDSYSGNVIEYSDDNYFIGPDTSNSPIYLMASSVSNSISMSYYRPQGWIIDEFYFTVDWFDIVDNTEPISVSVCIVPAQTSSGTGVSNTYGVKKFLMQTTEGTPDYSGPVEYYATVNFTQLGYIESEIGVFHYYFEAITDTSKCTYGALNSNNDTSHSNKVLVKPVDDLTAKIDAYVSNGNPHTIDSDTDIRYIATVSDHTTVGISNPPTLSFSSGGTTEEYEMTHYYTSSDGTEEKYYLDISGADLKSGKVDVEFDAVGAGLVIFGVAFVTGFINFDFLSDTIGSMISTVTILGIVPITLFNVLASLALANSKTQNPVLVGPILGVSIAAVILSAGTVIFNIIQGITSENLGQLLGFSIACLLLYIMISNFDVDKDSNIKGLGIFKTYMKNFLYIEIISSIMIATMGIVAGLFPDNTILGQVLLFIAQLFTIVPTLGGVMVGGLVLSTIVMAGDSIGGMSGLGGRIFLKSYKIYKNILLVGTLVGFALLIGKLLIA